MKCLKCNTKFKVVQNPRNKSYSIQRSEGKNYVDHDWVSRSYDPDYAGVWSDKQRAKAFLAKRLLD